MVGVVWVYYAAGHLFNHSNGSKQREKQDFIIDPLVICGKIVTELVLWLILNKIGHMKSLKYSKTVNPWLWHSWNHFRSSVRLFNLSNDAFTLWNDPFRQKQLSVAGHFERQMSQFSGDGALIPLTALIWGDNIEFNCPDLIVFLIQTGIWFACSQHLFPRINEGVKCRQLFELETYSEHTGRKAHILLQWKWVFEQLKNLHHIEVESHGCSWTWDNRVFI